MSLKQNHWVGIIRVFYIAVGIGIAAYAVEGLDNGEIWLPGNIVFNGERAIYAFLALMTLSFLCLSPVVLRHKKIKEKRIINFFLICIYTALILLAIGGYLF